MIIYELCYCVGQPWSSNCACCLGTGRILTDRPGPPANPRDALLQRVIDEEGYAIAEPVHDEEL